MHAPGGIRADGRHAAEVCQPKHVGSGKKKDLSPMKIKLLLAMASCALLWCAEAQAAK